MHLLTTLLEQSSVDRVIIKSYFIFKKLQWLQQFSTCFGKPQMEQMYNVNMAIAAK